jgi:hypothetical protein
LGKALVVGILWILLQDTDELIPDSNEFLSRQLVVSVRSIWVDILLDVVNCLDGWALDVLLFFCHDRNLLRFLGDIERHFFDVNKLFVLNDTEHLVFDRNDLLNIDNIDVMLGHINYLVNDLVVIIWNCDMFLSHLDVDVLNLFRYLDVFDLKLRVLNFHRHFIEYMLILINTYLLWDVVWHNFDVFYRMGDISFLDVDPLMNYRDCDEVVFDLNNLVKNIYWFDNIHNINMLVNNSNRIMDDSRLDEFIHNIYLHLFLNLVDYLVYDINILVFMVKGVNHHFLWDLFELIVLNLLIANVLNCLLDDLFAIVCYRNFLNDIFRVIVVFDHVLIIRDLNNLINELDYFVLNYLLLMNNSLNVFPGADDALLVYRWQRLSDHSLRFS